ncbi:MAG: methylcrotonoyl-CoA carboxylase, partial [Fimbriimonadaceae bacterium]|nr:methylcrotonoyl-CoA carboxylase [Fimbriimonadaceae bacterium]
MEPLRSTVHLHDDEHRANRAAMDAILDEYRSHMARAMVGGGEDAIAKHRQRGKLLARERIEDLLDPGAPFMEFSTLAAHGMYGGDAPSAGLVTGIGRIHGRECVLVAN